MNLNSSRAKIDNFKIDNFHETQLIPINSLDSCLRTVLKVNVFVHVAEMENSTTNSTEKSHYLSSAWSCKSHRPPPYRADCQIAALLPSFTAHGN